MAESQQGSAPSRDLEDTRNDLAQASLTLNTAYDRLRDLRTSLRNFSAQRDRLTRERARRLGTSIRSEGIMGPDHSAIVLSDSDEESEIDMETLRGSLPARLLELTSRWNGQYARLNAARQLLSPESHNDNSSLLTMSSSEDPRAAYPPLRRRRPLPPAVSSRDSGLTPPSPTSPARRSILETHLRQLRHASNPAQSNTTLGRRVAQRAAAAAAAAQGSPTEAQVSSMGTVALSDTIVHSTPFGIEPRPYTSGPESRAASHLRYSLLPSPPSGVRTSSGPRMSPTVGSHPRHSERVEPRPRTVRSNSMTTLISGRFSTSNATEPARTLDASTQTTPSPRPSVGTATLLSEDDAAMRLSGVSELNDSTSGSYRVRRRVNGQGEEHVFSINWGELMSEAEREDGLSDPTAAAWMRPPHLPRMPRSRASRMRSLQDPETDDTVVQDYVPFFIREGREGSVQRRRGWARLNADGDEISTEDEAALERSRVESRIPRTRYWASTTTWGESTAAVLDFVHRNSLDMATARSNLHPSDGHSDDTRQLDNNAHHVINRMFRSIDAATTYASPLPVPPLDKATRERPREHIGEVQVILNGQIAGR